MKKTLWIVALFLLAILLVACGGNTEEEGNGGTDSNGGSEGDTSSGDETAAEGDATSEGEEMTIRLGSHLAPSHSVIAVTEKFKEIVEEESDGRIAVEIHPSGELGGQSELIQSLQVGGVEMTINDAGVLSNFAPKVGVLDLPYTFTDYDHVHNVLDSDVTEELEASLEDIGVVSLGWVDSAFRDLMLNQEISGIEDVEGLKVRVPDAPQYTETVSAWGASATPVAWGDLYTALETGVVDGFEGSAESIYSAGLHEVVDYRVPTNHIFTVLSLNISQQFYDGLSEEDQTLLADAGEEAAIFGRDLAMERDEEYKTELEESGIELIEVDQEQFRTATEDFVNSYAEENGLTEILEQIRSLE